MTRRVKVRKLIGDGSLDVDHGKSVLVNKKFGLGSKKSNFVMKMRQSSSNNGFDLHILANASNSTDLLLVFISGLGRVFLMRCVIFGPVKGT